MRAIRHTLTTLTNQRPEWAPWLAVVGKVLEEAETPSWAAAVPEPGSASNTAPRLAGATIAIERTAVAGLFERLVRVASRAGTREMKTLSRAIKPDRDVLDLFRATLCHDADHVASTAVACDAEPDAFQAVVSLLPVPFLQACNAAWRSSIPEDWSAPYCAVCGSWPAFAEVRGIERSRYYRCGRCGGEWHAHGLSCPFCATTDHRDFVALVSEQPGASMSVDACKRCLGFVKTFNRLQACSPRAVMLEELSGAALDIAALEQGYVRPTGPGYALDVQLIEKKSVRRLFARNA